jgi:DNA-directed RNA polymerase
MRVAEDDRTLDRSSILRTQHKDVISAARYAIGRGTMAPALAGLNALQSVPWKINTWIMDVIRECYERNIKVDGIPIKEGIVVPERLPASEFNALPVEERRLHRKSVLGLRKANSANDNDTVLFTEDMEIAKRLAPEDQFYTPMNMDWRGRVYSLTNFAFARGDYVRAMFLFARGEQITERGLYWIKIHVANSGAFEGVDKKPLEERIAWVDQNLDLIRDYVRRPLFNTGWTKADSPFVFLAACRELVSALSVGSTYVTALPVSFDGSCNGLQHLTAMTRSTEARLVNLTDNAVPLDVYQVVADRTRQMIEADLGNNSMFGKLDDEDPTRKTVMPISQLARIALPHVDRKLCKRNVMTFAYSSKEFGMAEQHYEDTMEPLELKVLKREIAEHPFGETRDEQKLMCRYLAKRTLAAIKETVSKPAEAMAFMQDLAKALAHEAKPVRWTSPAGIPCVNRYHESIVERIELFVYDKGVKVRTRVTVAVDYEKPIKKDKAAAAIAANFTHSMDAAALLLCVQQCASEGITDVATVHDSFGCLPSQADRFHQIIRETFKRMYEDHDVLAELLATATNDLTPANHHRLPALPEKGSLDIAAILRARFAFA